MNDMYERLKPHIGHHIECACYGDPKHPVDICIECEDCNEVLVSSENYLYLKGEEIMAKKTYETRWVSQSGGYYRLGGFACKRDLDTLVEKCVDLMNEYGSVTLTDICDLADIESCYTFNKICWYNASAFESSPICYRPYSGWYVILPQTLDDGVKYTPTDYRRYSSYTPVAEVRPSPKNKAEPIHITVNTQTADNIETNLEDIFRLIRDVRDREVYISFI